MVKSEGIPYEKDWVQLGDLEKELHRKLPEVIYYRAYKKKKIFDIVLWIACTCVFGAIMYIIGKGNF